MKRKLVLFWVAVVMASICVTGLANAESLKVGLVDLSILLSESSAGKRANAQLAELITSRQSELDEREAAVLNLQARLNDDENPVSADERPALEEEHQALVIEYLTLSEEYEAEIQAYAQELRNQLLTEIGAVLQWYGDTKEYTLILDSSSVLYYRRVIDLTWDILREYDDLKASGQL